MDGLAWQVEAFGLAVSTCGQLLHGREQSGCSARRCGSASYSGVALRAYSAGCRSCRFADPSSRRSAVPVQGCSAGRWRLLSMRHPPQADPIPHAALGCKRLAAPTKLGAAGLQAAAAAVAPDRDRPAAVVGRRSPVLRRGSRPRLAGQRHSSSSLRSEFQAGRRASI